MMRKGRIWRMRQIMFVSLSIMSVPTLTRGDTCSYISRQSDPCGEEGKCHLVGRRPVSSKGPPFRSMVTCSCKEDRDICTQNGNHLKRTVGQLNGGVMELTPSPGMVVVVDHVAFGPSEDEDCDIPGAEVAGVSYWCQGKPDGCSLDPKLIKSLSSPFIQTNNISTFSVSWHEEPDYNSREIPCPSYGHGALEKKFIPLENTCFIKTTVKSSWQEARAQCWDWGGDLAFPLPANNTTPKSWLQDDEEIWLAGSSEFHARPAIGSKSPQFQEGTYMVCFSDLWRCTQKGPHLDLGCDHDNSVSCLKPRRGLCALPPRRIEYISPDCPPATDTIWELTWQAQPPGTTQKQSCPANQNGEAEWGCGKWGLRETDFPNFSNCKVTKIDNHVMSLPGSDPSSVLETLNDEISDQDKNLATGDIESIVDLLDAASNIQDLHISQAHPDQREELSEEFLIKSVETVDHLVSQPEVWLGLDKGKVQNQIDSLQNVIDNAARHVVDNFDPTSDKQIVQQTENLNLQVKVLDESNAQNTTFGIEGGSKLSVSIKSDVDKNGAKRNQSMIVFKSYNNLGCIINQQKSCNSPDVVKPGQKKLVNSKVLGADVYSDKKKLVNTGLDVILTFEHVFKGDKFNLSSIECVYWDTDLTDWNTSGCHTLVTGPEFTQCQCTHLTNFAVLMDINGIFSDPSSSSSLSLSSILSYLTIVCSSLSLAGLLLSLYVFTCIPSLKNDRIIIHRHLCSTLLLAHLLLLGGLDATTFPLVCTIIAVCLHWLLLSAFCWMLIEGYHIYKLLTDVFQTKRCGLLPYYLIGYGVPSLFVASCIAASEALGIHGYGTTRYCWLDTSSKFIWAFAGPVAGIVLINIFIYILAMRVARRAIHRKNNDVNKKTRMVTWLKGSASLLCILGTGWVSGFLYMWEGSEWMGVVFTVLNSSQGIAIFFLHVVFNDPVKKKLISHLRRKFHIGNSLSRNTTSKNTMRSGRGDSEMSYVENGLSRSHTLGSNYKETRSFELSDSGIGRTSGVEDGVSVRRGKPDKNKTGSNYGSLNNNKYCPEPEPEPDY